MRTKRTRGVVSLWNADEGWGVLDSPDVPDRAPVWAHFSAVEMDGFRSLEAGQAVDFAYERADQDGYRYRATTVTPA